MTEKERFNGEEMVIAVVLAVLIGIAILVVSIISKTKGPILVR